MLLKNIKVVTLNPQQGSFSNLKKTTNSEGCISFSALSRQKSNVTVTYHSNQEFCITINFSFHNSQYPHLVPLVSVLRKPVGQHKRHKRYNKVSRRRSNNGKDVLRRRHVVFQGSLGSPVRRSPRFAGQRTPVGTVVSKQQ